MQMYADSMSLIIAICGNDFCAFLQVTVVSLRLQLMEVNLFFLPLSDTRSPTPVTQSTSSWAISAEHVRAMDSGLVPSHLVLVSYVMSTIEAHYCCKHADI